MVWCVSGTDNQVSNPYREVSVKFHKMNQCGKRFTFGVLQLIEGGDVHTLTSTFMRAYTTNSGQGGCHDHMPIIRGMQPTSVNPSGRGPATWEMYSFNTTVESQILTCYSTQWSPLKNNVELVQGAQTKQVLHGIVSWGFDSITFISRFMSNVSHHESEIPHIVPGKNHITWQMEKRLVEGTSTPPSTDPFTQKSSLCKLVFPCLTFSEADWSLCSCLSVSGSIVCCLSVSSSLPQNPVYGLLACVSWLFPDFYCSKNPSFGVM